MNMIFKYSGAIAALALCTILSGGCRSDSSVLIEEERTETENVRQDDGQSESISQETTEETPENSSRKTETEQELIYVDICGAVNAPGVYQLPAGSRIFQAVEMAGGFSAEAAAELVNQAGLLEDGQQIRIYTREEAAEYTSQPGGISGENPGATDTNQTAGKVNINRADKDMLMTLTGIGETRAEAILAYREEHGGFLAIEDLMQVEGIKEKTYEKLKDEITVN